MKRWNVKYFYLLYYIIIFFLYKTLVILQRCKNCDVRQLFDESQTIVLSFSLPLCKRFSMIIHQLFSAKKIKSPYEQPVCKNLNFQVINQ